MQWIKTGRQIGQAVKNVHRLRQIMNVFAKHGFADVINRLNLGKAFPGKRLVKIDSTKSQPQRMREAFEELGPTFVKLGQLLSTRPDIIPEKYIEEFTKLQDKVAPIPFSDIEKVIESEFKSLVGEIFESLDKEVLASASISQVHVARLHSGEEVVVKVQRPGIKETINNDISILAFIARLLERYIPEVRIFAPTIIVDEFFRTLSFEIDFRVEANNMNRMAKNLESIPEVKIPKVYKEYSSEKVLTLERLDGTPVNQLTATKDMSVDRKRVVEIGARAFFKSIMIDGLFHGDLHGGNVFVLKDGRIGLIDFGIVGRLSEKSRDQLANMLIALLEEDFEKLCYQYAELGDSDPSIDFVGFQRDLRNKLSPYLGMNLSEVNTGRVLIDATKIATQYKIRLPGDWMIVFKAMLTIEGMGRNLDPDFDFLAMGHEMVKDLIKHQYSPQRISRDIAWTLKDLAQLSQDLPRQIRWMFQRFNKNDFALEVRSRDMDELKKQMKKNNHRSVHAIVAVGILVAAAISLSFPDGNLILGYPAIAFVLFMIGFGLSLRALL